MLSAPVTVAEADLPRTYESCAVIGNGPGIYLPGMGNVVDKHDAVFKFNLYNLGDSASGMRDNNTKFSGSKSTFRTFNKKRSEVAVVRCV